MRKSRRIAALALTAVVLGGLTVGPARAQTETRAESHTASASAEAMRVTLFGNDITVSGATAEVNAPATGEVTARGWAGSTLLGPVSTGEAEAAQTGDGSQSVDAADQEECPSKGLEAVPGVGLLEITCPKAEASVAGRTTAAQGHGSLVTLDVSASQLLDTIQLRDPVSEGVDQLWEEAINPIVENLTGNPVGDLVDDTTTTLHELLNDILHLETTVRVQVAPVLAQASGEGDASEAWARAQGVRIEILPVDALAAFDGLLPPDLVPGEPLITIVVGDAWARSTHAGGDGPTVHESEGAVVRITIGTTALLETLGLSETEIVIDQPGTRICLLEDTPLETCVALADAGTDADGAWAEGATVELLKGVEGGVELVVGTARTGALGAPSVSPVAVPAELPRTGGALLPLLGLGMLGLAVASRRLGLGRRS